MKTQKTARLGPNAQIHEESYCARCGGVALCESWCESVNACVRYARDVVLHPAHLSFGDQIILHALGVRWTSVGTQSIQRPAKASAFRCNSGVSAQLSSFASTVEGATA